MTTAVSLLILGEVIFALFIVWGFMHEERFVAFEDKIIFAVLRAVRRKKAHREIARREKINEKVVYTPVKPVKRTTASRDSAA
ncbi:MAG: hypothetical protein E7573_09820 [Ruminococcaceae bacterium]|nr:hypothetical protein [Oscillospiraceae bacterium]MBR3595581.1 hypothetical protein [Clostridia bacterium]